MAYYETPIHYHINPETSAEDENLGICYDWHEVEKLYRKLNVPAAFDYTANIPLTNESLHWFMLLSERSVGKTTGILLIGMCCHALYDTQIQYCRCSDTEIQASNAMQLFDTVCQYRDGEYIRVLTNGMYDSICYYWGGFYYCNSETGDRAEKAFMKTLALNRWTRYKSVYNCPRGDIMILDEFITDHNFPDEFINFCDIFKTCFRDRIGCRIFLLANSLDINNIWFRQLEIDKTVKAVKKGKAKIINTSRGMPIYTLFVENKLPKRRNLFNTYYLGFTNSRLNAITGNGDWNINVYQNICDVENFEYIYRKLYLKYYNDTLFKINICYSTDRGSFLFIHPVNYIKEGDENVIITNTFPLAGEFYFSPVLPLAKLIVNYWKQKQIYYDTNATGDVIENFIGGMKNGNK